AMTINKSMLYTATIKTSKGAISVELDPVNAPNAVNDFVFLADQHFYDGLKFTRVERIGQISPLTQQPSNIAIVQGGAGGVRGGQISRPAGGARGAGEGGGAPHSPAIRPGEATPRARGRGKMRRSSSSTPPITRRRCQVPPTVSWDTSRPDWTSLRRSMSAT